MNVFKIGGDSFIGSRPETAGIESSSSSNSNCLADEDEHKTTRNKFVLRCLIKHEPARVLILIELLVVIPITGILVASPLAAISSVKAKPKRTACLNNLKQINLGLHIYGDDHESKLPDTGNLTSVTYKKS